MKDKEIEEGLIEWTEERGGDEWLEQAIEEHYQNGIDVPVIYVGYFNNPPFITSCF